MNNDELRLIKETAKFTHDPYTFVKFIYPWGEDALQGERGPRKWQEEFLEKIGDQLRSGKKVIREAIASGHGIGKSTIVGWLIHWGLSTFPNTRIIVTANTEPQLKTKTWPEIVKWNRLAINSHWFTCEATSIFSNDPSARNNWRCDRVTWNETNPEAFQGLHNKGKRILLLFDEASAIPEKIWEVSLGALTDENTEIIWCVFGNPTRNTGSFRECFGRMGHRWGHTQIDSRTVEGISKTEANQLIEDYGEDSDIARVRVRGMFPNASSLQLIDSDLVSEAMKREERYNFDDSLIMSLDIARGGDDRCAFVFRRGLDARSIKSIIIPGSEVKDSMRLVSKTIELIKDHKPDYFFYDGTGVGGPVGDRIKQLGHKVIEVQFGAASPNLKCANMRSYMYVMLKEWLKSGGAIENKAELEMELTSIEYAHNKKDQLILESKEEMKRRGLASPDYADALAMTFAYPVAPKFSHAGNRADEAEHRWNPYA